MDELKRHREEFDALKRESQEICKNVAGSLKKSWTSISAIATEVEDTRNRLAKLQGSLVQQIETELKRRMIQQWSLSFNLLERMVMERVDALTNPRARRNCERNSACKLGRNDSR